jgi:two-component system, OmpR family, response regulator
MDNNGVKRSVLIIDDDSFLLDMYAMRFTQAGFDVTTAISADEVMSKLKDGLVPDIALLDVVMPNVDGFELLENINKEGLIPNTIKIFLSNLGQDADIARGKSLGAASYIVKASSTPSEVVAHVLEVLDKEKKDGK